MLNNYAYYNSHSYPKFTFCRCISLEYVTIDAKIYNLIHILAQYAILNTYAHYGS